MTQQLLRALSRRPLGLVELDAACGGLEPRLDKAVDWLLEQRGAHPSLYVHLLKQCGRERSLAQGRRLHSHIVGNGFAGDRLLGHHLIGMYAKCGSVDDAKAVFDGISPKNLYSWTEMIVAYSQNGLYRETVDAFSAMVFPADKFLFTVVISAHTQNGHPQEALLLFWGMQLEGMEPDSYTLTVVLGACTELRALAHGKAIHDSISATPLESHMIVGNSSITMFGKCGSVEDARRAFSRMKFKDVVSWNALMGAYAQNGHSREGLRVYQQMLLDGTRPDPISFVGVLDACGCLEQGKAIHSQVHEAGVLALDDEYTGNALLSMYGRCGNVLEARKVFDKLTCKGSVTWSAMLTVYTQLGCPVEALELAKLMSLEGVKPNRVTFLALLAACAHLEDLEQGRLIHAGLLQSGEVPLEVVLQTSLVNMYGKCGSLDEARAVLDHMDVKTVVSWNSMITAYAQHDRGRDALQLLKLMDLHGAKPSKVTFISTVDAVASTGDLLEGRAVHGRIVQHGLVDDIELCNALISMYARCGSLPDARLVFHRMRDKTNVVSWNAMVAALSQHGCGKEAVELVWRMDQLGVKPDRITFMAVLTACTVLGSATQGKLVLSRALSSGFELGVKVSNILVNLHGKCGDLVDAERAFHSVACKDVVSWNAMLTVYVQRKSNKQAMELFRRMDLEGVKPDEVTMVLVLDACSGSGNPVLGRQLHERTVAYGLDEDELVRNAVVDMYGKYGNLGAARQEFDRSKIRRDVFCWTCMVAAYAQKGRATEGLKLFWGMQQDGVRPDAVAFLCAVFACSHVGRIRDAFGCFVAMVQDHGVSPLVEHYCCIIDMLGKAGWLAEAEELAAKAAALFPADVPSARALLGACTVHGDSSRAARAAQRVEFMDPSSDGLYVLLSNMYATTPRAD